MVKKSMPKKFEEKKDNTAVISISAGIALQRLCIDLREPTPMELSVFGADVALRVADMIAGAFEGGTVIEKKLNCIKTIAELANNALNPPAQPLQDEEAKE